MGMVGTFGLFIFLYWLLPTFDEELASVDRLVLAIKCLVFPVLIFFLTIVRVGSQRYGNPSENPVNCVADTEGMKIDLRVLSNTHEQLMVMAINTLALSIFLPFEYLSLLPIYSALFVIGRILFWVAYHKSTLWRAPGYAMSTLPAIVGLGYCGVMVLYQGVF